MTKETRMTTAMQQQTSIKSVTKFKNIKASIIQNSKSYNKAVQIQLQKCKNTKQSVQKLSSKPKFSPMGALVLRISVQ